MKTCNIPPFEKKRADLNYRGETPERYPVHLLNSLPRIFLNLQIEHQSATIALFKSKYWNRFVLLKEVSSILARLVVGISIGT